MIRLALDQTHHSSLITHHSLLNFRKRFVEPLISQAVFEVAESSAVAGDQYALALSRHNRRVAVFDRRATRRVLFEKVLDRLSQRPLIRRRRKSQIPTRGARV